MASVELRREAIDDEGHTILTDGPHVFFPCSWSPRIRWALRSFPDDGVGLRTHGAAWTLEEAVRDANRVLNARKAVTP